MIKLSIAQEVDPLEKETVTIPKQRLVDMLDALKEIHKITKGLTTFNPTYNTIHQLTRKGLNIQEDDADE